ncbi:hypothetical protein MKX01_007266, partial [Papaver californicum]
YHHQQSLLKELVLMPGHTKAGELGKNLHGLSHQRLGFLHLLSFPFNELYFL